MSAQKSISPSACSVGLPISRTVISASCSAARRAARRRGAPAWRAPRRSSIAASSGGCRTPGRWLHQLVVGDRRVDLELLSSRRIRHRIVDRHRRHDLLPWRRSGRLVPSGYCRDAARGGTRQRLRRGPRALRLLVRSPELGHVLADLASAHRSRYMSSAAWFRGTEPITSRYSSQPVRSSSSTIHRSRSRGPISVVSQSTSHESPAARMTFEPCGSPWVTTHGPGASRTRRRADRRRAGDPGLRPRASAATLWPARRTARGPRACRPGQAPARAAASRKREVLATGKTGRDAPRCGVQAAEERPHPAPVLGTLELAVLPRHAVDERFDSDRVGRVETAQDRSAAVADRRHHELQSGVVPERGRRSKRRSSTAKTSSGARPAWCPARRSSAVTNHREPSAPTASQWWLPKPIGRWSRRGAPMPSDASAHPPALLGRDPRLAVHGRTLGDGNRSG